MSFAKKLIRYFLPLGIIILAILVVIGMATMAKGKRPDRQETGQTAVLVDVIKAETRSLNFIVQSQGSVRPRTQTNVVAQVSGITIFETGTQAQLVIPMAASLAFGILFATLILIPSLFLVLNDFGIWWKEAWRHVLSGSKVESVTPNNTVDSGLVSKQQSSER